MFLPAEALADVDAELDQVEASLAIVTQEGAAEHLEQVAGCIKAEATTTRKAMLRASGEHAAFLHGYYAGLCHGEQQTSVRAAIHREALRLAKLLSGAG